MERFEKAYAAIIAETLKDGKVSEGRNATTISTFGKTLEIQLGEHHFPLLLGRKMYPKGILGEFAAFLKGPKTVKDFEDEGCNYWKQWGDSDGSINVDYGNMWVDWHGTNQLQNVIDSLQQDPHSRRHLISGWDPQAVADGVLSLPCCHYAYQFYVTADGKLDMIWIQRSVDLMIGLPSDIVLAAAFNIMIAQLTGLKPGKVVMQLGDCHVYQQHAFGAIEYLDRVAHMSTILTHPQYKMESINSYTDFSKDTIVLGVYSPREPINFELIS